jgi:hypothetical protein
MTNKRTDNRKDNSNNKDNSRFLPRWTTLKVRMTNKNTDNSNVRLILPGW